MPVAFVTGGSGFVGRNLIPYLLAKGYRVRALARSEESAQKVAALGAVPARGDLDSTDDLSPALLGADVIFHAAAHVKDWDSRDAFFRTNVTGTARLVAAAVAAKVPRFVHVSTEAVLLGGPMVGLDESVPIPSTPLGPYAWSKGLSEREVLQARSETFAPVIVRPRFLWGPGDTTLLPELVKGAGNGTLAWIGGGMYLTSTCHVENLCEGLLLAAERGASGEIYFVTDGEPIAFRTFIAAMLESQGVVPPKRSVPRAVAGAFAFTTDWLWRTLSLKGRPPVPYATFRLIGEEVTVSDSRARRELGYTGHVSREQGLKRMAQAAKR